MIKLITLLRAFQKPLAIAAVIAAVILVAKLLGDERYRQGRNDCERDRAMADLTAFKAEAERLSGLSDKMEKSADVLRDAKPKIIERQTRVEIQNPLPVDCVIPADRLRISNDAIRAANAARQPGETLPADRPAGK